MEQSHERLYEFTVPKSARIHKKHRGLSRKGLDLGQLGYCLQPQLLNALASKTEEQ
jgi:hypothetical protein